MIWIIGILLLAGILLLIFALRQKPAGQDLVEERLGREKPRKEKRKEKKEQASVLGAAVDRIVAERGFAKDLATQLARADIKLTVGEFLVLSVILALLLGLLFYAMDRIILVPVGILLGFMGPRWFASFRQKQRLKAFNDQLSDALNLMVNSLRAGYSTLQAMEVISREMPDPIAKEFGRVVLEIQLGVPFDTAMENLLRRMPSPDMDLIVTAMSIQREVGGNLAEVLDSISFTIRERVRIKGEISVLTAQGRISGYIVAALPFLLGGFLYLYSPDFFGPMVTDPCGWAMLGTALFLIVIGYIIISKIVNIEV